MQTSPSCLLSVTRFALLLGVVCLSLPAAAQTITAPNEWTWVAGSSTPALYTDIPGVYGTLGSPAPGNTPGGRSQAITWTDKNGNLWLLGGNFGSSSVAMNDFWEFIPSQNEWAWMGGTQFSYPNGSEQPGIYGTLLSPDPLNIPGGRVNGASWTDKNGNLWLFGGWGYDANGHNGGLNDLWKFDPLLGAHGEWTWMGGSSTFQSSGMGQPGVYGSLGKTTAGSIPGGRGGATTWTDKNGNFWLFGGSGYDASSNLGFLNDLWEFIPSANQWIWMGGSSTVGQPTLWNKVGDSSAGNSLGGRMSSAGWIDNKGNFWLYGGQDSNNTRDDLWELNSSTGDWNWIGGDNTPIADPVFGTLGTPAAGNTPGSISSASSWTDQSGNFWLFGGNENGYLGALWELNPTTTEWTWMGGSQSNYSPGVYGTMGTPAIGNSPAARFQASNWTGTDGKFWLFGGWDQGWINDLWVYQPSATPSFTDTATPQIKPGTGTYTAFQTVTITDSTPGAIIYYTTDGTTPTTSSPVYSSAITVLSASETIKAIAMAENYLNSQPASATYTLNLPTADTPTISPAAGTYSTPQSITFTDTTPGTSFFYTTDGSTPTVSNADLYTHEVIVSSSATVRVMAAGPNLFNSPIASASYVITPTFTVPSTLPPLTLSTGTSAFETINVTALYGFNSTVYFSCSGLPTEAVCSFSPPAITGGGSIKITVIATAPNTAVLHRAPNPLMPVSALAALLCCFGLRKHRRLLMLLLVGVSMAGLSLLTSCGGGSSGSSGPPPYTPLPNTETVTVTAQSGSITQTTLFVLTVND
ncbi:MAG: chitobiase/beta-hexosaminidase C-terminal domain-containing protein [Terracidiphilus sp.]